MYKIIIYNNDLELVKNICNKIIFKLNDAKLLGISTNEKELTLLTQNAEANTILISGTDIKNSKISQITSNIKNKIILCDNSKKYKNSKYHLYISQPFDPISIQNNLTKFMYKPNEKSIRKKFHKILKNLNFDFKLNGTNYLLDAIIYSYITKDKYLFENLEKNVYPYVAKKYGVSNSNIKWSIIRSVNNMNYYCLESHERTTPKLLISNIINCF